MKKTLLTLLTIILTISCSAQKNISSVSPVTNDNINYQEFFTGNTMRFDFHHAGDSKQEFYYFDRVIREGVWAGSHISLINPFDYGEQHFRIIDKATGNVIYKNNYCTLFNEWQTTPEAEATSRSFPESVIFPEPKSDFTIEIYARNKVSKEWEKKFSQTVNVNDFNIIPAKEQKYENIELSVLE